MSSGDAGFAATRGMRDFYPEDMRFRNRLFDAWRRSAERFGFQPYDAPVVESLDLLKRKSGEEIIHQIYAFEDKSGRPLALRPEMTPSLARMVAARQGSLVFPLKWYAIAQCFRYERMTRGRKREHYQWNLDVIGEPAVTAEVEVLATAVSGMAAMGLSPDLFQVHYSSRKLLAELLLALGIAPDHHATAFLALDKRGKIPEAEIDAMLVAAGLQPDQCRTVWRLLEIANPEQAAALLPPGSPALAELERFRGLVADYGMERAMRFNIAVVRGLAYYTGIVFEAFDTQGQFRALFGGGRYDNLLASVGGRPQTGVGLGMGDVVIGELLAERGLQPDAGDDAGVAIGFMDDAQRPAAARLALRLRSEGRGVDLALAREKPGKFFARAAARPFQHAIYVGPDDLARGTVRLKDLASRQETELPLPAAAG